MEQERKSEASRTVSVESFEELVKTVNKLVDAIEKHGEAKKWPIVALKALSQLSALQEFVKSSIADLEKLDALREINRVLKPKGYFICFDLVYPRWAVKMGKLFRHSYGILTINDLRSFIEKHNFSTSHSSLSRGLFGNPMKRYIRRLNHDGSNSTISK